MPRLTVKAAAELLQLPGYEQMRVLLAQKHPRQEPQVFRAPFYLPALTGIREYYRRGRDVTALAQAKRKSAELKLHSRRVNNERVLTSFEKGREARRVLLPVSKVKLSASLGQVEISLSLDLLAHEAGAARYIYYNFRAAGLDPETAKTAIDIAFWVMQQSGASAPIKQIEYVDFAGDRTHRLTAHRQTTLKRLRANVKMIEAVWPTL